MFVNTQSTFFNATYGSLTDSQFINALYVNIAGNAGDPGGVSYWEGLLEQAEGAIQPLRRFKRHALALSDSLCMT